MQPSSRIVVDAVRSTGLAGASLMSVAILDSVLRLLLPAALAAGIDSATGAPGTTRGDGATGLFLLGGLLVLITITEMTQETLRKGTEAQASRNLRQRTLRHVLRLGAVGQRRFSSGDMLTRSMESTRATASSTGVVVTLLTSLITSIGGLLALFWIDPLLGLVFAAGAPVIWWLTRWLIRRVGQVTTDYQRVHGDLSTRFVDAIRGARTIRASGTAHREIERIVEPLGDLRVKGQLFWDAQRSAMWQMGLCTPLMQVGVLLIAGFGVLNGTVTPGELLASQFYLFGAMGLLRQTQILAQLARARGSAQRLHELFVEKPPQSGDRALVPGRGQLSMSGISLSEGDNALLNGVDVDVPAGCSVAIVGESAGAKSALTEVAGGLVTPDSGQVLLDGVPMHDMRPEELRSAIGYAFERPNLLGETVGAAVAYSDNPPSSEDVAAGLRTSAADGFTANLPQGVDTPLLDLGVSGGEWQRLGLARALARPVRVLLCDDAMSSLDTVTESTIMDRIEASSSTTRVLVTHRMSTAARADLVLWLDDGAVRAFAPHERLRHDPEYLALFQPRRARGPDIAEERTRDPELTAELQPVTTGIGDPEKTRESSSPC